MENLIIILSALLNIALIIALAVYMKRFNKVSEDFKNISFEREKQIKSKEEVICELNNTIEDYIITMDERQKQIVELVKKCDSQNAKIESLLSINSTLLNDNRKLSDELQEIKNKPFDPLKELDNLTIRKEEKATPEAKPEKKRNKKETEKESARH